MKETNISIDGYDVRISEKGSGPAVILLHGLGGSLEWWESNLNALSQKYRVIAFDFLGFGHSAKPKIRFSLDVASDFMLSFLDAFALPKASLIGNSMGGLIALHTASKFPERVERLILVDNAGFGPEVSFILCLASVYPVGEFVLAMRNHFTARMILSHLFYDSKRLPSHLVNCILRILDLPRTGEVCLEVLRSGVNLKGLRDIIWISIQKRAESLPHKTLIIWGADDRITPLFQAYMGKNLIKNSKLLVFEKCGHLPQVEWAEKFNRAVVDFLES
ncbi:MAG: alpha/beta fold hydrolase [Candidatus Aminicenantes bacterium]|nr:MAG: alpha/beta fold hydrolase [Candidatus Aminicenantes bacterium]